jgi:hypothetical protein
LLGYIRVSTQDQNLDLQRAALEHLGCEKIYEDQISGSRAERPGLSVDGIHPGKGHSRRLEARFPKHHKNSIY